MQWRPEQPSSLEDISFVTNQRQMIRVVGQTEALFYGGVLSKPKNPKGKSASTIDRSYVNLYDLQQLCMTNIPREPTFCSPKSLQQ